MILEFLKHIWPSQGFYCIAVPAVYKGQSYYAHSTHTTVEGASTASTQLSGEGKDCYMAVGTLKERRVWCEKEKKYVQRVHENMDWYRSLILDIDCGEGKPYVDQNEANAALQKFRKETLLPKPTVVNSGYGLHVYYTMTRDVDAEEWLSLSLKLKAIAKHLDLKVDDSRTSDKSSVLRVAGTNNHKRGKIAPVQVRGWGEHTRPEMLKGRLDTFIEDNGIKVVSPPKKSEHSFKKSEALKKAFLGVGDVLSEIVAQTERYHTPRIHKIAEGCNFIRHALEVGGKGFEEPSWRNALSVTLRSTPVMNVEVSEKHEGYSEGEMLRMVERLSIKKPFRCTTIAAQNPDLCKGCTKNVRNPLMLDMRLKSQPVLHPDATEEQKAEVFKEQAAEVKTEAIEETQDIPDNLFGGIDPEELSGAIDFDPEPEPEPNPNSDLKAEDSSETSKVPETLETRYGFNIIMPDPPPPYKLMKDGVYVESEVEEDVFEAEKFCDYHIKPYGITADAKEGMNTTIMVSVKFPNTGKENTFEAPAIDFWDSKLYLKLITGAGVFQTSQHRRDALQTYMQKYIEEIQKLARTVHKYNQLGWHEEGKFFVLPECTLHKDGTVEKSDLVKGIKAATKPFGKKGTLEEWKSVIDMYNRPSWEKYAFGHLVGYGSLLMRFTTYPGAIVNFVGESGTGKTGILDSINTIFGQSEGMMIIQEDKQLAKMARFGIYNSICTTYDEITKIDNEQLSSLCYAVSQGRGRHRLNQNAELKDNDTTWQMILASTSNSSLLGKLSSTRSDGSAESLRVFEYRIDKMNDELSKNDAQEIFDKLKFNYGHAGEPFLNYVVQHESEVQELVTSYRKKFDEAADVPISERYWSAIVSTVLAGGHIANKLDLASFDLDKIFLWAVDQVHRMRSIVADSKSLPHEILGQFISDNYGCILTVSESYDGKRYTVDKDAHSKLYMRFEPDTGRMFIDKKILRSWVGEAGHDMHLIKTTLKDIGVLLKDDHSKTLTAGSNAPSTGQIRCWVIDTTHPKMGGPMQIVKMNTTESKVVGIDKS